MTKDDILKDVWHFWNRCFYNRTKPSRKILPKGRGFGPGSRVYEVKCYDCGKTLPSSYCVRRKIMVVQVLAKGLDIHLMYVKIV